MIDQHQDDVVSAYRAGIKKSWQKNMMRAQSVRIKYGRKCVRRKR